jgi:hypothetical protein
MTACDFGATKEECRCIDCREVLLLVAEPKTELQIQADKILELEKRVKLLTTINKEQSTKIEKITNINIKQKERLKYYMELVEKNTIEMILENENAQQEQLKGAIIIKITPVDDTRNMVHLYKLNK